MGMNPMLRFHIRAVPLVGVWALGVLACGGGGDEGGEGGASSAGKTGSGGGGAVSGGGAGGTSSSGGSSGQASSGGSGSTGGGDFGAFSCGPMQCNGAEQVCIRALSGFQGGGEQYSCSPYPEGCAARDCSCFTSPACDCSGEAGKVELLCAAP